MSRGGVGIFGVYRSSGSLVATIALPFHAFQTTPQNGVTMSLNEQLGSTYALVFPGQGSQVVGMGRDLADASPAARDVLTQADAVLGFPLSQLCCEGPAEELEDTYNAQPAILTVSIAALRALEVRAADAGETLAPAMVAGHSLGEFTAMVVADV